MHLYLARITLHHAALGIRSQAVSWHHVSRDEEFDEEVACIKAAVDAVGYTSSYLERNETNVLSWHSAYIIFISAITLLTGASFMSPPNRTPIQGTIDTAVRMLSNTIYGSWHAKSCYLQFTQVRTYLASLCMT